MKEKRKAFIKALAALNSIEPLGKHLSTVQYLKILTLGKIMGLSLKEVNTILQEFTKPFVLSL